MLQTPDVVVMDNLNIHKMEGIEELSASGGARVEYLPPYSPDFNPPLTSGIRLIRWPKREMVVSVSFDV